MNFSDDDELLKNNCIKTYLHIHNPSVKDKPYYKIDKSQNILYLHNQMNISESESDGIFEFDKIFTNENKFSDIYENICGTVIHNFYEGKSYCFISYGNTMSDKFKILIGDNNDKGILLQSFDDLIKNNKSNMKLSLSYFCLYNDKIIDLSCINSVDYPNHKFEDNFIKKGIEIGKNYDINNLNKINIENNSDDINEKIDKLFSHLIKIERNSKYHIYITSHFCFIIYLLNTETNNIISTMTFILLNGSELLNKNNLSKKSEVSTSLKSVESQYIYNSIIYSIGCNKAFNHGNKQVNFEKDKLSKLTGILNDICFNPDKDNIKFIIIGNIIPITGYYETTKDTLMFLFNIRQSTINKKTKNKEMSVSRKLSRQTRDDVIFDLESKIKFQADSIENLNKIVQNKDEKIFDLEKNYKVQVEYLKNYFGFQGKIEVLLSGDVNTKEFKEASKIREAKEDTLVLKRNIMFLEKNMKKKEEEINKLKNERNIRLNDQTMINYYFLAEDIKKNKEKENENKKELFIQLQKYENDIKTKDKIIEQLKKELEQKNKLLLSIPKVIKNKINIKEKEKKTGRETERKENVNTDEIVEIKKESKKPEKNEYIEIIKKNKEENDKIILKYKNLLSQNQKQIEEKSYQIEQIIKENKEKHDIFKNEFNKFFESFTNLINSSLKNKNSNTFEKSLENIKKEINEYNYPNIYKLISAKNKNKFISLKTKEENNKTINKDNLDKNGNNKTNINNSQLTQEKIKDSVLNFEGDVKSITTLSQINNFIKSKNKTLFSYNKYQLEQMPQDDLVKNYLEIISYMQTLEIYFEHYKESQENIQIKKANDTIISEYEEKIKILKSKLDAECHKNYNNLTVINSQKKLIEQFNYKNILNINKTKLKDKYPVLSTSKYCPTISNTKYKDNLFLKSKNYSQLRNNTEKNICDKILGANTEQFDIYKNSSRNKNKINNEHKRPFSSTSRNNASKNFNGNHISALISNKKN